MLDDRPVPNPRYRLDGCSRLTPGAQVGWPTLAAGSVDAPVGGPLALSPLCADARQTGFDDRLCLTSADGTMGGLRLPPWLAVDAQAQVFLLTERGDAVLGLRPPGSGQFSALPLPRLPAGAHAVHAASPLYVLGRDELLVYDRALRVTAQIGGLADVVDSAVQNGGLLLLRSDSRLAWLAPGAHWLERLPMLPGEGDAVFRRIVATRDGGRAVLTGSDDAVLVDRANRLIARMPSAPALRGAVPSPPLSIDGCGRFALPPRMLTACPEPAPPPPLDDPLAARHAGGTVYDRQGRVVEAEPGALAPGPVYEKTGWWLAERLDGKRDAQVWRTGIVRLDALPPGTRVRLEVFTNNDRDALPLDEPPDRLRELFRPAFDHREPAQRPRDTSDPSSLDFHIAARPGRYLWLRMVLAGDGRVTPRVGGLEVTFGGARRLDLLPAEFRREEPMRDLLERLFGLLDTGIAPVEAAVDRRRFLLDPRFTNDGMLAAIEGWLGLAPDPRLDPAVRRRLLWLRLQRVGAIGTREGLRQRLTTLLSALTGLDPADVAPLIRIVEGFETRAPLRLGQRSGRTLSAPSALSTSTGIRLGTDILDSRTDPAVADFQRTAHRVDIALPRALAPDDTRADMLRRAVAEEVPAHVAANIDRYPGGVRLDAGARLGIETLLLDPRAIHLACGTCGTGTAARLGIDARLTPSNTPQGAIRLNHATSHGGAGRLL